MKIVYPVFLFCLLFFSTANGQNPKYNLTYKVLDKNTRTPIENTQISITPCNCGGITNNKGIFSITLPSNTYSVKFSHIGYKEHSEQVILNKDSSFEIVLSEDKEKLSQIVVLAKRANENIESPQMGALKLDSKDLKKLPTALGEIDVLKGMTLLAGVSNAGDISNGLSVRGGSLDQNLILYDYAPVFNPTHLFGLFSVFTPDAISSVNLYRANIPSRYGGRVASVIDIKSKQPFTNTFKLSGGLGLVSSRLLVETPIVKDKLMVMAGARVGLSDFLLPIVSKRLKNTKAKFGDATLKLLYLPTEKDQISFTGFFSKDFYQLDLVSKVENVNAENNQYDFGIINGTLNWIHTFNENTNLKTVLVSSRYTPKIIFPEFESDNEIVYQSRINYLSLISELSKKVTNNFDYYAGIQANRYKVEPGSLDPGSATNIRPVSLLPETNYELSGYINTNWKPNNALSISTGLRYNYSLFVGPYNLAKYDELGNIIETEFFEKGKKVKSYNNIEPRVGLSYKINKSTSVKASYAKLTQYLQNVYNSTTPLPTSRWKTADRNIKPQTGDTYGLGLYKNLNNNNIEMSMEGYYRKTNNVLAYKPGADFFLEEFLERDVIQGQGKSYGIEFSLKKPNGKVNGWFNYTWSKSLLRSNNETLGDRINRNEWYPSDFDRPHVFNSTINFEGTKHHTFSFNFTMQSGRPYSIASNIVKIDEVEIPIFLERNNARLPLYHRLDFSWNINFNKYKKNKRWLNDWTFTVYNLYARKNPFNIFYVQRNSSTENASVFLDSPLGAFSISAFNSPLFSLTYNFKFQ
ncbi:TonB-dependent receptor [Flavivirga eckloniae]|uniref:TonB-dependent receptor n=1 Tax=Flavivirga eckloniae TaxID=1803846 RepID=A0A2K9PTQ0_9FLAO|nr:TonB-dependent receptor [Flavivirga eckloniae]AUP80441.1 TonB-dependent receptor [Flavivirga eckloniae]